MCFIERSDVYLVSECSKLESFNRVYEIGEKSHSLLDHPRILTSVVQQQYVSLCVRKPTICMGENKDADQLRGNREADQRLCFRYTDSTFPLLLIPKFSRFWVSSVTVQAGLCLTWSKTQIVGFLMHRLMYVSYFLKVSQCGRFQCYI